MNSTEKSKELQKRLINHTLAIVKIVGELKKTQANLIFSKQIIRSASSMGSNYTEAIFSYSRPDFIHNVNIAKKEAGETLYWLELLGAENLDRSKEITLIKDETLGLLKIFVSIVKTSQK
jgi:four helix bundle protein